MDLFNRETESEASASGHSVGAAEKLGNVLDLQEGPLGRFKASAEILTPLVGSLVGLLLK